ncbi:unnamed protein product [Calicophoron daubneyi]|uniref:Uncharacterized protein n=1 Tax=Calicophoron daubneyi TaxID=300641 RepID=A0AAV2T3B1_CALDB
MNSRVLPLQGSYDPTGSEISNSDSLLQEFQEFEAQVYSGTLFDRNRPTNLSPSNQNSSSTRSDRHSDGLQSNVHVRRQTNSHTSPLASVLNSPTTASSGPPSARSFDKVTRVELSCPLKEEDEAQGLDGDAETSDVEEDSLEEVIRPDRSVSNFSVTESSASRMRNSLNENSPTVEPTASASTRLAISSRRMVQARTEFGSRITDAPAGSSGDPGKKCQASAPYLPKINVFERNQMGAQQSDRSGSSHHPPSGKPVMSVLQTPKQPRIAQTTFAPAARESCPALGTSGQQIGSDEQLELVNPHPVISHAQEDPIETHDEVVAKMAASGLIWAPPGILPPSHQNSRDCLNLSPEPRWYSAEIEEERVNCPKSSGSHSLSSKSSEVSTADETNTVRSKSLLASANQKRPGEAEPSSKWSEVDQPRQATAVLSPRGRAKCDLSGSQFNAGTKVKKAPGSSTICTSSSISKVDSAMEANSKNNVPIQSNTNRSSGHSSATLTRQPEKSTAQVELQAKLEQEVALRQQQDDYIRQLQMYYDNLLAKHALAEVTIDQLRTGAKVRGESEERSVKSGSRSDLRHSSSFVADRSGLYRSQPLSFGPYGRRTSTLQSSADQLRVTDQCLRYASTPLLGFDREQVGTNGHESGHTEVSTPRYATGLRTLDNNRALSDRREPGSGMGAISGAETRRVVSSTHLYDRSSGSEESGSATQNTVRSGVSARGLRGGRYSSASVAPCRSTVRSVKQLSNSTSSPKSFHTVDNGDRKSENRPSSTYDNWAGEDRDANKAKVAGSSHPSTMFGRGSSSDHTQITNGPSGSTDQTPLLRLEQKISVNPASTLMDLLFHVANLQAKVLQLRRCLADQSNSVSDNELQLVRLEYGQLKKCFHLATRRWPPGSVDGAPEFDPEGTLDKELYELRLQLDDLEACAQLSKSSQSGRNDSDNLSSPRNEGYQHPAMFSTNDTSPRTGFDQTIGLNVADSGVLSSPSARSHSDRDHGSSTSLQPSIPKEKLCALESDYMHLLDRYNTLKESQLNPHQAQELYDLMKGLYELTLAANGQSSVIPTPHELENVFQLDGDTRKLTQDLERAMKLEREMSAYSSFVTSDSNGSACGHEADQFAEHPTRSSGLRKDSRHSSKSRRSSRVRVKRENSSSKQLPSYQSTEIVRRSSSSTQDSGLSTPPITLNQKRSTLPTKRSGGASQEEQINLDNRRSPQRARRADSDSSHTGKSVPSYSNQEHPSDSGLPNSIQTDGTSKVRSMISRFNMLENGFDTSYNAVPEITGSGQCANTCDLATKKRMEALETGVRILQQKLLEVYAEKQQPTQSSYRDAETSFPPHTEMAFRHSALIPSQKNRSGTQQLGRFQASSGAPTPATRQLRGKSTGLSQNMTAVRRCDEDPRCSRTRVVHTSTSSSMPSDLSDEEVQVIPGPSMEESTRPPAPYTNRRPQRTQPALQDDSSSEEGCETVHISDRPNSASSIRTRSTQTSQISKVRQDHAVLPVRPSTVASVRPRRSKTNISRVYRSAISKSSSDDDLPYKCEDNTGQRNFGKRLVSGGRLNYRQGRIKPHPKDFPPSLNEDFRSLRNYSVEQNIYVAQPQELNEFGCSTLPLRSSGRLGRNNLTSERSFSPIAYDVPQTADIYGGSLPVLVDPVEYNPHVCAPTPRMYTALDSSSVDRPIRPPVYYYPPTDRILVPNSVRMPPPVPPKPVYLINTVSPTFGSTCRACGGSGKIPTTFNMASATPFNQIIAPLTPRQSFTPNQTGRRVLSSNRSVKGGPLRAFHNPMNVKRPVLSTSLVQNRMPFANPRLPIREYSEWGGHRYFVRQLDYVDSVQDGLSYHTPS